MSTSTGIHQNLSSVLKINGLFMLAIVFLICCSIANCDAKAVDQLSEQQIIDGHYPSNLFDNEANIFQRAAPRLGRASPRLGRASPRLGRRTSAFLLSQLNPVDDSASDSHYENEFDMQDKRAAPRLGRSIQSNEQQNKA